MSGFSNSFKAAAVGAREAGATFAILAFGLAAAFFIFLSSICLYASFLSALVLRRFD